MSRLRCGPHFLRDEDGSVVPVGIHYVPVQGPDWPWRVGPEEFDRAFERIAALGLDSVRIDLIWAPIEPREGEYDERHLEQLDAIFAAARRHGLRLHPVLFVGGEVGDAVWDVPWRDGRHPHADPAMRELQARQAAALARRWGGAEELLAWDLTDEPPIWLFQDTDDAAARAWTAELAAAIRAVAADDLITIGTASQEVDHGPFRADVVAPELHFTCVHPYPIYSPELYPDALLAPRMTHAAAFEVALAAGAGRAVMLHEYGASSAQFDPEAVAAYDRLLAWSSFGRGAIGFFPWCWIDAEPAAYRRAPYVRMAHETQFGLLSHDGAERPRAGVLGDLAARLAQVDLDAYAAAGPVARAACPVPHEYVTPYDPAAYGLEDPAGPYVPAEPAWNPERDVKPLVRAWLNCFVLAARADVAVSFPREALDDAWPDADLLLLPAPLTSSTNSLWHLRTSFWAGAEEFLAGGGTVYLSLSADSAIPEMESFAGCRIVERAPAGAGRRLRFEVPWGPFAPGEELALPAEPDARTERGPERLHHRGVVLATVPGAEVIATDAAGNPALVSFAGPGGGLVVTCAFPVELLLADVADAHGSGDPSWGLYAGIVTRAGAAEEARAEHPDLTSGSLRGSRGGLLVVTNHGDATVSAPLQLPDGASAVTEITAAGPRPHARERLELPAHDALVLTWDERGAHRGS
ncbi:MAG TPA: cellulase family glycosylhydrolase [Solirubrobacterales bacterium]|nr:cellulase family glycosylhydrolase [Solirubrobacterales bacterium]